MIKERHYKLLESPDQKIFCQTFCPENPHYLFIPGFPATGETYKAIAEPVMRRGASISFLDMRGLGRSSGEFSMEKMRECVFRISRKYMRGDYLVLIGHSFGGFMADYIAADDKTGVFRAVIDISGPVSPHEYGKNIYPPYKFVHRHPSIKPLLKLGVIDTAIKKADGMKKRANGFGGSTTLKNINSNLYHVVAEMEKTENAEPGTYVTRIRSPLLLIGGIVDHVPPSNLIQKYEARTGRKVHAAGASLTAEDTTTRTRLVLFEKMDHEFFCSSPDMIVGEIEDFLETYKTAA